MDGWECKIGFTALMLSLSKYTTVSHLGSFFWGGVLFWPFLGIFFTETYVLMLGDLI